MYNNSYLSFVNNSALQEGGGLYVEYTSNAYFLTILNKNCFLQYYSNVTDIPPNKWVSLYGTPDCVYTSYQLLKVYY